jgi:A/G-specific adenine glycosylase
MDDLVQALTAWFGRSQRPLPWRQTGDPYAVWVSEVMLQQTQVERVIPFYLAFLERFPTVEALARAPLDDVLARWRGLGYYARARALHAAARQVVEAHRGQLPKTVEGLRTLPGFGRYTAGAVASIAFGVRAPIVDGNVARVLSRLFEVEGAPGEKAREARLWALAEGLVPARRPGDFNQALMELGATVCLPSRPLCLLCPVSRACGALRHGRVEELPPPRKAARRRRLELAVAVAQRRGAVLLARRPEGGLFGGLWELPCAEASQGGARGLERLLGPGAVVGPELVVVERTLTHRELVLRLHPTRLAGRLAAAPAPYTEWRWVARAAARRLGMSSAMEAVMEAGLPSTKTP